MSLCVRAAPGHRHRRARNTGATAVHDLCAELETMARNGELSRAAGNLADLEREYVRVEQARDEAADSAGGPKPGRDSFTPS